MAVENGTHPDLWSTSHPDKSQEAAVLDDRLSRCPPRRRLPGPVKELHIIAHKYSQERRRPHAGSHWCEKVPLKAHFAVSPLSLAEAEQT